MQWLGRLREVEVSGTEVSKADATRIKVRKAEVTDFFNILRLKVFLMWISINSKMQMILYVSEI